MKTITKTFPNGAQHVFSMEKETAVFTSHIWIRRDGKLLYHVIEQRDGGNRSKVLKWCDDYGWLPFVEIPVKFEDITLKDFILC